MKIIILFYLYAIYKTLAALLSIFITFLLHPSKLFQKPRIFKRPAFLQDDSYGTHHYITVNNIKLHCVISGPENAPIMLMLHGFPEFWYSWRYQIREFNKDYRVVAVDLRGYGDSDKPLNTLDYTIPQVTSDIIELISTFDGKKCTLVAHDWGGIIAWRVVYRRPDLIDKFIVMCCPHSKRYNELARKDTDTALKQWYVLLLRNRWLSKRVIACDDFNWLKQLFTNPPSGLIHSERMTEEDLEAFQYTFSQPHVLNSSLNYYSCMFMRNPEAKSATPRDEKIPVPTLLMMAEHDSFLNVALGEGHDKYVENVTLKYFNCSHWLQQDCPEEANSAMREFIMLN